MISEANTVYVVYFDYGYGERSVPQAVFNSEEKAKAWLLKEDDTYRVRMQARIIGFNLDDSGGWNVSL